MRTAHVSVEFRTEQTRVSPIRRKECFDFNPSVYSAQGNGMLEADARLCHYGREN